MGSFGTLGVTTSQVFATIGYAFRGKYDGWDLISDADSFTTDNTHAIRFAAPSQLLFSVPGVGEAVAEPNDGSGSTVNGQRISAQFGVLGGYLNVGVIRAGNADYKYTLQAEWYGPEEKGTPFPFPIVTLLYGIATPAGSLPTSGSASFAPQYGVSSGISVDFATKAVTAKITRTVNDLAYTYEVLDGKLSADGTQFSGRLVAPGAPTEGKVEGIFAGPIGEELMIRFVFTKADMLVMGARRT